MKLLNLSLIVLLFFTISCGTNKENGSDQNGPSDNIEGKDILTNANDGDIKENEVITEIKTVHDTIYLGEPSVTATKMNVLYRGIRNPIDIAVPGIAAENLQISMSNATFEKCSSGYLVEPGKGKRSTVSISAKLNGTTKNLTKKEFRVESLPDPVAYVGGVKTGRIQISSLRACQGVIARLENFPFDVKYSVKEYVFSTSLKGQTIERNVRGPRFSADVRRLINQLRKGQKCYFENIKVKAPDGSVRNIGTIALKII
ncbi:hypothetical protein EYV94_17730 [Puteibacter caeruleilacunae]|nr:hypothetical protein EYV94_17730 [Puteibacter caeruleilacunae]